MTDEEYNKSYFTIVEITNEQASLADDYLDKAVGDCGSLWGSGPLSDEEREQHGVGLDAVKVRFRTRKSLRQFHLWCNFNSVNIVWTDEDHETVI